MSWGFCQGVASLAKDFDVSRIGAIGPTGPYFANDARLQDSFCERTHAGLHRNTRCDKFQKKANSDGTIPHWNNVFLCGESCRRRMLHQLNELINEYINKPWEMQVVRLLPKCFGFYGANAGHAHIKAQLVPWVFIAFHGFHVFHVISLCIISLQGFYRFVCIIQGIT